MGQIHTLNQTKEKHQVQAVFHFVVPSGTNAAGLDYSECVKRDKAPAGSIVPNLQNDDPTEYNQILNGQVYELQRYVEFNANLTPSEKQQVIKNLWMDLNNRVQAETPDIYQYYGLTLSVP